MVSIQLKQKPVHWVLSMLAFLFVIIALNEVIRITYRDRACDLIDFLEPEEVTVLDHGSQYRIAFKEDRVAISKIYDDIKEKNVYRVSLSEAVEFISMSEVSIKYGHNQRVIHVDKQGRMLFPVLKQDIRRRTILHRLLPWDLRENDLLPTANGKLFIYYISNPDDNILNIIEFIKRLSNERMKGINNS